jgi:hypothetical protein
MKIQIQLLTKENKFELIIQTNNVETHSYFSDNPQLVERLKKFISELLLQHELVTKDNLPT